MAPRKTATAPADKPADAPEFSNADNGLDLNDPDVRATLEKAATDATAGLNLSGVPEPGIVTEDLPENTPADWPSPDYQPTYPVSEAGVPDPSTELYPGDDVEFLLDFLEHLAPEQFERAKQRFMLAANEARA